MIALVTGELDVEDPDTPLVRDALSAHGIRSAIVSWRDPDVRWAEYSHALLRSPWDYFPRPHAFLEWLDAASRVTRVVNPPALVRWNLDKRYVAALAQAGLPVIPTVYVAPGESLRWEGADDFVVKPTISAGARDSGRYTARDLAAARAHVTRLHAAGRTAMVQPYVRAIDTEGERALVFLEGSFSHAIRKEAVLRHAVGDNGPQNPHPNPTSFSPTPEELDAAQRILRAAHALSGAEAFYARVDLVPGPQGPLLLELEVIEPFLFLTFAPGALGRFTERVAELGDALRVTRYE
jgi:glutathione synthase/RimK-type ligase-like ATP-grasp enzyme